MNYQETIDYLYSRLPVFQNIGARAYKPGLHTTIELCKLLGDPQNKYPSIHVGGTNGKGSTSHMLAAVLSKAGYKVGLYTSPHLKSFTERIKVNGVEANEDYIVKFVDDNLSNIDRYRPSFFELTVAMAFSYFADQQVDVAVIEVGMGGRQDSTNVIKPVLSIITNVSFDHVQYLGDTLPKIAYEKAGIIKPGVPAVISEYHQETAPVFERVAQEIGAPISFSSEELNIEKVGLGDGYLVINASYKHGSGPSFKDLRLDLTGSYQLLNIGGVLKGLEVLTSQGYHISNEAIKEGLAQVTALTGLKGRWQKLQGNPLVYCDTAHNVAGLSQTLTQFNSLEGNRRKFVIGFVGDKDISSILLLFPKDADYYFTQPSNARALPVEILQSKAAEVGLYGNSYTDVNAALTVAIHESNSNDLIYVGGSTFVVADLNQL